VFPLPPGEQSVYQGRHPLGTCLAERAIELVGQHLVAAVREPKNLPARSGMALAATIAGLAFSNIGVALVHAMEYPVGGAVHVSHGAGNGLLLPYVMRYNLPARKSEFAQIARLLGKNTVGLSEDQAAESAIAAVSDLRAAIGIPARLRDIGVHEDQLPGFAEKAFGIKRILRVNPREPTVADIESIFRERGVLTNCGRLALRVGVQESTCTRHRQLAERVAHTCGLATTCPTRFASSSSAPIRTTPSFMPAGWRRLTGSWDMW
jgi:hypothetical protein